MILIEDSSIIFVILVTSNDYSTPPQFSAAVLHSLVIHLNGGNSMVGPGYLHLANLLPLLLIFQPAQDLNPVSCIICPTSEVEHVSQSDPPHSLQSPGQGGGLGPASKVHCQHLSRGE